MNISRFFSKLTVKVNDDFCATENILTEKPYHKSTNSSMFDMTRLKQSCSLRAQYPLHIPFNRDKKMDVCLDVARKYVDCILGTTKLSKSFSKKRLFFKKASKKAFKKATFVKQEPKMLKKPSIIRKTAYGPRTEFKLLPESSMNELIALKTLIPEDFCESFYDLEDNVFGEEMPEYGTVGSHPPQQESVDDEPWLFSQELDIDFDLFV